MRLLIGLLWASSFAFCRGQSLLEGDHSFHGTWTLKCKGLALELRAFTTDFGFPKGEAEKALNDLALNGHWSIIQKGSSSYLYFDAVGGKSSIEVWCENDKMVFLDANPQATILGPDDRRIGQVAPMPIPHNLVGFTYFRQTGKGPLMSTGTGSSALPIERKESPGHVRFVDPAGQVVHDYEYAPGAQFPSRSSFASGGYILEGSKKVFMEEFWTSTTTVDTALAEIPDWKERVLARAIYVSDQRPGLEGAAMVAEIKKAKTGTTHLQRIVER